MNRRHPRTWLRTEIWLGQDGIFTRTPEVLRNLSERGAFIQTQQRFSKGTILSLRFRLPMTGKLLSTTVIVRNMRSAMIGVGSSNSTPTRQPPSRGRDQRMTPQDS